MGFQNAGLTHQSPTWSLTFHGTRSTPVCPSDASPGVPHDARQDPATCTICSSLHVAWVWCLQLAPMPFLLPGVPPLNSYMEQTLMSSTRAKLCTAAAAAAKSLQSCLTLCNPIDGSQPGSPIPGSSFLFSAEWYSIVWMILYSFSYEENEALYQS